MGRKRTNAQIRAVWIATEAEFPTNSTEFLISVTADRCGVSYSEVVDALWQTRNREEPDASV